MFITVKRPDSDETLLVSKKAYDLHLADRGFRDVVEIEREQREREREERVAQEQQADASNTGRNKK